jgi:hypothetical protein
VVRSIGERARIDDVAESYVLADVERFAES